MNALVWDFVTGQIEHILEDGSESAHSTKFSHDESKLAIASGGSAVRVWNFVTGRVDHTGAHSSDVFSQYHELQTQVSFGITRWDCTSEGCFDKAS